MSTLTKEEMDYLEQIDTLDRACYESSDETHIARLRLIIGRLVAENEELRKKEENKEIALKSYSSELEKVAKERDAITRHGMRLEEKLSALIKAAEPIVSAMRDFDPQDSTDKYGIVDGHIMDKYGLADITIGDLRNLNKAVKGAKS